MAHRSVPCPANCSRCSDRCHFHGLAIGAVNAHMAGVAAARARREEYASQVLYTAERRS